MDMQNRAGSKHGGGIASAQSEAIHRTERLRQLALETIDIKKDPYLMRNHMGQLECKLCLTSHRNEGNYLAHTQGKRHQDNLGKRMMMEQKQAAAAAGANVKEAPVLKSIKIGRPGYRIVKHHDEDSGEYMLQFELDYPEVAEGIQPRYRFMSTYEQKIEPADPKWQYVLFAAEPYETVAFKVLNWEIDRSAGKLTSEWDSENKKFHLQVYFHPRS